MDETLTISFSEQDEEDLREWKGMVATGSYEEDREQDDGSFKRRTITMPAIEASNKHIKKQVEESLEAGKPVRKHGAAALPLELVEAAKATFIASGGNVSEVAALYDLTPEAVIQLAASESWPVYGGGTKAIESRNKAQLRVMQEKIWHRIEKHLDSLEVEKKAKHDIVQHRLKSEYVEPLASRSSTFKMLMDQYMRIGALLEPEVFANDTDPSNIHARKARESQYPGGIEGVNRELADFLSEVVVGVADKMKDRELRGYGDIIDAEVLDE